jgi:hypothetical protein
MLIVPIQPSGFGSICHDGVAYDTEGNQTAGTRSGGLDRYSFSIRHGHLFLGSPFNVSHVEGEGKTARIRRR